MQLVKTLDWNHIDKTGDNNGANNDNPKGGARRGEAGYLGLPCHCYLQTGGGEHIFISLTLQSYLIIFS